MGSRDHAHLAQRLRTWARIVDSAGYVTLPDLLKEAANEIEDLVKNSEFDLRMTIHLERKNDVMRAELDEYRRGNLE